MQQAMPMNLTKWLQNSSAISFWSLSPYLQERKYKVLLLM
jgi:hypothetical protein